MAPAAAPPPGAAPPQGSSPAPPMGGASTHPGAVAQATTEGLPVSWPVPTRAQQQQRHTSATAATNAAARAKTDAAPAGRAVSGGELEALASALNGLLEQVAPPSEAPVEARKRQDTQKRLEELYERLQAGQVKDADTEEVQAFAKAVAAKDFATAHAIHVKLAKGDWNSNKSWLMGLKRLLPLEPRACGA